MLGVVGRHASAKHEAMSVEIRKHLALPTLRQAFRRQPDRVAHGRPEKAADRGAAAQHRVAMVYGFRSRISS